MILNLFAILVLTSGLRLQMMRRMPKKIKIIQELGTQNGAFVGNRTYGNWFIDHEKRETERYVKLISKKLFIVKQNLVLVFWIDSLSGFSIGILVHLLIVVVCIVLKSFWYSQLHPFNVQCTLSPCQWNLLYNPGFLKIEVYIFVFSTLFLPERVQSHN